MWNYRSNGRREFGDSKIYSNMAIKLLYIDLFCGAGGTSTGVHLARHDGEPDDEQ